ncbi:MAG: ADP-ribosylglycohydrolase family protein [Ignavibacteriales bacterium]|nr:ADP-ribosylglycohydrolase family protein [Ignavibacteriales bacterium]
MRVAPFGIVSIGDPELAAQFAQIHGSVSNSGEGIYSGQAVAAAVAMAMADAPLEKIIQSALDVIPKDSWTFSSIINSVKIGNDASDVWNSLKPLYQSIACSYYFWTDVAPEAVGLAFGIIAAARGKFEDAVLGAVNIGRDTDTIAAIAGAICGALHGINVIPERWINRISVSRGICINAVKGMNIMDVADDLASLAQSWSNQ